MSDRKELPWDKIHKEIIRALHEMALVQGQEFFVANTKYVAEYVSLNPEEYPFLNRGCTYKGVVSRITMAINQMGWDKWTTSNKSGRGMKYIVPWRKIRC